MKVESLVLPFGLLLAALAMPAGAPLAASATDQAAAVADKVARERARRCALPVGIGPEAEPLPALAKALRTRSTPVTIVVLGPQAGGGARQEATGIIAYPPRLQGLLSSEWRELLGERKLVVEAITRPRGASRDLAALIPSSVLPLKPALVIWQIGRADARRSIPPARAVAAIRDGAKLLRRNGIDLILMDNRFHPEFEALYRTDDYRQHLRWYAGSESVPLLRRYQMMEYWASAGHIDLESGLVRAQRAATEFVEDCLAWQAARMLDDGVAPLLRTGNTQRQPGSNP